MKIRRGIPFGRYFVPDAPHGTFLTSLGHAATCDVSHSGTEGRGRVRVHLQPPQPLRTGTDRES
jgi:hypothetical protein